MTHSTACFRHLVFSMFLCSKVCQRHTINLLNQPNFVRKKDCLSHQTDNGSHSGGILPQHPTRHVIRQATKATIARTRIMRHQNETSPQLLLFMGLGAGHTQHRTRKSSLYSFFLQQVKFLGRPLRTRRPGPRC